MVRSVVHDGNLVIGGRYHLLTRIAEGGMAVVWKARVLGAAGFCRTVAVKEIKAEYRSVRKYIQMFIEEARVGTKLAHPNIVQVVDFLIEGDTYFLVLEWVDGVDLSDFARAFEHLDQPVPWPLGVAIAIGALQGLHAAHSNREHRGELAPVIHRDVSPHNLLLDSSGIVKLSDFGLARARDRAFTLTAPGMLKGKLNYMAPEVADGRPASARSDQFSMGAVLWGLLAGERLFDGDNEVDVYRRIRFGEPKPLSAVRSDVPERVVRAVHKSLARDPNERFADARMFAIELNECLVTLGDGLFDAAERVAAAVQCAQHTLAPLDAEHLASACQPHQKTWSFHLDVERARFQG